MRRYFAVKALKREVLDSYRAQKNLSFLRCDSHEIKQLTALYSQLYKPFSQALLSLAASPSSNAGRWGNKNCYLEVLQRLVPGTVGGVGSLESALLHRYDHGAFSLNTTKALLFFIRLVRSNVEQIRLEHSAAQAQEQRQQRRTVLLNTFKSLVQVSPQLMMAPRRWKSRLFRCLASEQHDSLQRIAVRLAAINRLLETGSEVCPISCEVILNRVELNQCHHVFEKEGILSWFNEKKSQQQKPMCPCCRVPFTLSQVIDKPKGINDILDELEHFAVTVSSESSAAVNPEPIMAPVSLNGS